LTSRRERGISRNNAKGDRPELVASAQRYCYPLTITDAASRYLICCEALSGTGAELAFTVFERIFKEFGLPQAIRTDNGCPFASGRTLFGLSKLLVWWLRRAQSVARELYAVRSGLLRRSVLSG
jgi:putative transposase